MATCVARHTPAGARPNRRRAAVLCDQDAAGWLLECVGDHGPREMTVRNFGSDRTRLTGPPSSRPVVASCGGGAISLSLPRTGRGFRRCTPGGIIEDDDPS